MARLSLVGFHYNGIVAVETVVKDQLLDPLDIALSILSIAEDNQLIMSQHGVSAACLQVALRSNAFNMGMSENGVYPQL